MTSNLDHARGSLAGALETSAEQVADAAQPGNPEAWNSLSHLRLILAVEGRMGRALGAEQIIEIEYLEDVAGLLERHAAD